MYMYNEDIMQQLCSIPATEYMGRGLYDMSMGTHVSMAGFHNSQLWSTSYEN